MLPQYTDKEYAALRVEAGKDSDVYKEKVDWLKKKWPQTNTIRDETIGMRLVGPLIYSLIHPMDIALMTDNLDCFKKHYKTYLSVIKPSKLLVQACLCGSKAVCEFLLGELKLNYLSAGQEDLLSYIAASPNVEWVIEIAKDLVRAGRKELPPRLSVFASPEMKVLIGNIFSNKENNHQSETNTLSLKGTLSSQ